LVAQALSTDGYTLLFQAHRPTALSLASSVPCRALLASRVPLVPQSTRRSPPLPSPARAPVVGLGVGSHGALPATLQPAQGADSMLSRTSESVLHSTVQWSLRVHLYAHKPQHPTRCVQGAPLGGAAPACVHTASQTAACSGCLRGVPLWQRVARGGATQRVSTQANRSSLRSTTSGRSC
jgi:hypothetical protein